MPRKVEKKRPMPASDEEEDEQTTGTPTQQRTSSVPHKDWVIMFDGALITKNHHALPIPLLDSSADDKDDAPITLPKVAAFDFDGTLCHVKSGNIMPNDEHDWEWFDDGVIQKIRDTYNDGYDIVVFTNQLNCIKENRNKTLNKKYDHIMELIGVPISWYLACDKDMFRKPARCMFDFMLDRYHGLLSEKYPGKVFTEVIDKKKSFYVGDAAGRAGVTRAKAKKTGEREKDFSSADFDFAVNVFGINDVHNHFLVPETFFNTDKKFITQSLADVQKHFASDKSTCPYELLSGLPQGHFDPTTTPIYQFLNTGENYDKPQIIVLSSHCATGKTTFAQELLSQFESQSKLTYSWVNQDTLKTPEKCYKAAEAFLAQGHVVLIDNTNAQSGIRKKYIDLAKSHKVPIHCVYLKNENKDIPFHLNSVRMCYSLGARERLPSVAINMSFKNFEPPTAKEGYDTFSTIPFQLMSHIPFHTTTNPCPPPPLGPSPTTTPASSPVSQPNKNTTTAYDKHPEYMKSLGPITSSRSLQDYFFQRYAKS